jgi:hypothetical protein
VTKIEADASDGVVGGVLSQRNPETELWHPIAYFLKTIYAIELNYDIYDKEILVIVLVLKEWHWLQGLQTEELFQLYSDH